VKGASRWQPGETIGILGGGQLGRMMILAGRKLGYRFVTLDPAVDCPGGQVADHHIVGAYHDLQAMKQLAERVDHVVYEFENMEPAMVRWLEGQTSVPQGSALLELTRHRLREKEALQRAGIPVARFSQVMSRGDLDEALHTIGLPAVLKTVTAGYDGKGQWMLTSPQAVDALPEELFAMQRSYIVEQFVPFIKELSMVVARNAQGEVALFPPTLNLHRHHILHLSLVPAPLAASVRTRVEQLGQRVAERLQVVGLIAVEMFLLADGQLWVNELAPRPHNSGHYTYDVCCTSQFEQFLRAVVGLPLGSTQLFSPAVMVNVLGEQVEGLLQEMKHLPANMKVHWYGKKEAKPGRKMGHVTVVAKTVRAALQQLEQIPIWPPLTPAEWRVIGAESEEKIDD
jgi:5-(carboxyamino)imidazole ribonucleotide synthase